GTGISRAPASGAFHQPWSRPTPSASIANCQIPLSDLRSLVAVSCGRSMSAPRSVFPARSTSTTTKTLPDLAWGRHSAQQGTRGGWLSYSAGMAGTERDRLADTGPFANGLEAANAWYLWGPYLAERAWGTVREDYGAACSGWNGVSHDAARSKAFRWNEEGLAGICDAEQRLCLAVALWNGVDPILKERCFGLTNDEGNHGEDVKEYWWYRDAVPSGAWLSWRYHYPQKEFPYEWLRDESLRRKAAGGGPEPELLDAGAFDDDRYWVIDVDYAKADVDDILVRIRATNASAETASLHLLPTLWFRNTWSWTPGTPRPDITVDGDALVAVHPAVPRYRLAAAPAG